MDHPPPLHRPEYLEQYGTLVTPLLPPPMPRDRNRELVVSWLCGFVIGALLMVWL